MTINYRDEMECSASLPDDDPELIAEIHACYAQIHDLEAKIKELESRPNLKVETGDLYKLTKVINDQKAELDAAEQNLQVFEKQWLLYKQKSDLAVEEILKLRQQVTKLETALEWYTEKGNMDRYIATSEHHTHDGEHWFNCWMMSPVTDVARKALGRKTETEELLNGRSNNSR